MWNSDQLTWFSWTTISNRCYVSWTLTGPIWSRSVTLHALFTLVLLQLMFFLAIIFWLSHHQSGEIWGWAKVLQRGGDTETLRGPRRFRGEGTEYTGIRGLGYRTSQGHRKAGAHHKLARSGATENTGVEYVGVSDSLLQYQENVSSYTVYQFK